MRHELTEDRRAVLGEMYLSVELMARDIQTMMAKHREASDALAAKVNELTGHDASTVQPVMEGYRLISLEVQDAVS